VRAIGVSYWRGVVLETDYMAWLSGSTLASITVVAVYVGPSYG